MAPSGAGGPAPLGFKSEPWEHRGNLILEHLQLKEPLFCSARAGPVFQQLSGGFPTPDVERAHNACERVDPASTAAQFQSLGCELSPPSFHLRLGSCAPQAASRLLGSFLRVWVFTQRLPMSHFLWQDAHHLGEAALVLGRSCFIPASFSARG